MRGTMKSLIVLLCSVAGSDKKVGKSDYMKKRTLRRNKKPLKYSNLVVVEGKNIVDNDGNVLDTGESRKVYSTPIDFKANIVQSGNGQAEMYEFGLNLADFNAVIIVGKDTLPITEGSLIWENSVPITDTQGYAKKSSADYIVVKHSPTPNVDKFILKRLVTSEAN